MVRHFLLLYFNYIKTFLICIPSTVGILRTSQIDLIFVIGSVLICLLTL